MFEVDIPKPPSGIAISDKYIEYSTGKKTRNVKKISLSASIIC